MRTLHLNDQYGWRGGEQQVLALLLGLQGRGQEVVLMAQPGSDVATRARVRGITVVPVHTRGEFSLRSLRFLRELVDTIKPHIVHCHTSHSHMHGLLACEGRDMPRLVVSRRVDFSIHKLPGRVALWKYGSRVDRIIAISEAVKRVLVQDGVHAHRIGVVYSGLDPARADAAVPADLQDRFGIPSTAPIICTVAALVGHKGHRYLVEAIPRVRRAYPDARFLFVGDGPLRGQLERQARALGVSDAILFLGFRDDFLGFTASCDVYVMPSHLEGLNTSVIDAMFLQRPVVVTDAGGLPELIRDGVTGRVVPKQNAGALATAIIDVLANGDQACVWGRDAREWALRHLTANQMVEGTLREYEATLCSPAGA